VPKSTRAVIDECPGASEGGTGRVAPKSMENDGQAWRAVRLLFWDMLSLRCFWDIQMDMQIMQFDQCV
jgi:hypothetical protein